MKNTFLLLILLVINPTFSQKRFENKHYGFSMDYPKNWHIANNDELTKNLEKFDLTDEVLGDILKQNNGSILLTSFYKYELNKHAGLIPTIKINVRSNPANEFSVFKSMISQSSKGFESAFPDFEYSTAPTEIDISGVKSVFFAGTYSMKTQNGTVLKIKSRTYAIPYGDYFFQVNFIDGQIKDDCTEEFDGLLKSIVLEKKN